MSAGAVGRRFFAHACCVLCKLPRAFRYAFVMQLIVQVWSTELGRYVEDELSLWDALPEWQRDALRALQEAFPGSEWVDVPAGAQKDSEAA